MSRCRDRLLVLDADDLWVASELLPGVTMADELARRGAVGPEEAARWGRDVADGLAAVHGAGVLHRNLHAGMVGLAGEGRAVVGGFATTATMLRDVGFPHSCVIQIGTGGESHVLMWATFVAGEDQAPAGVAERFGQLTIYRQAAGAGSCQRTVVLGDQSRVFVTAHAHRGAATDLCAVADAGIQTAVCVGAGDRGVSRQHGLLGRGVTGLTRDEVGEPVGNVLNHNLILELLLSTTLVPPDLRLLD